jgi:hypothetical protein
MSDRSRHDGTASDRASEKPSQLKEIAADLRSAGVEDASERHGRRPFMEPLSLYPAIPTVGLQVASERPPVLAASPSEDTAVTSIGPRPSLVVCTVHFAAALQGSLVESLSGVLRREYPHAAPAPQLPSGSQMFFSAPGRHWAVWLTPCAFGLETRRFQELGELHERLGIVMRRLEPRLYSRVGLRCVYQVPVSPRPLRPDQRHLSQVVQWRSYGGQSCFDLDVSVENVTPVRLEESLEEIFRASRPLPLGPLSSPGADFWGLPAEAATVSSPPRDPHSTTVAAFPELLPFPPQPSETETVADERADLLAREYDGDDLSHDEQERLSFLTARLEKLLAPAAVQELESLVEMAEEADQIRQWARESRNSLGLK